MNMLRNIPFDLLLGNDVTGLNPDDSDANLNGGEKPEAWLTGAMKTNSAGRRETKAAEDHCQTYGTHQKEEKAQGKCKIIA